MIQKTEPVSIQCPVFLSSYSVLPAYTKSNAIFSPVTITAITRSKKFKRLLFTYFPITFFEAVRYICVNIVTGSWTASSIWEYIRPLKIPVIFITAKGDVKDRVKGLRLGAEDYLVKPFDVVELLARVEVVLRRFHKRGAQLSAGDVVVDMEARMVTKAGVPVVLTNKEYGLLVLFIQNKNIALFKESLYEKVWGEEYDGDSRTLELHVQRLRKKMGWENQLVAVYKVGYRLEIA